MHTNQCVTSYTYTVWCTNALRQFWLLRRGDEVQFFSARWSVVPRVFSIRTNQCTTLKDTMDREPNSSDPTPGASFPLNTFVTLTGWWKADRISWLKRFWQCQLTINSFYLTRKCAVAAAWTAARQQPVNKAVTKRSCRAWTFIQYGTYVFFFYRFEFWTHLRNQRISDSKHSSGASFRSGCPSAVPTAYIQSIDKNLLM